MVPLSGSNRFKKENRKGIGNSAFRCGETTSKYNIATKTAEKRSFFISANPSAYNQGIK